MGFTITEELSFSKFGVNAAGCYCTIKGSFAMSKLGSGSSMMYLPTPLPQQPNNETPYTLSARWLVYASNDASLQPLREETISIQLAQPPANCYETVYDAIKAQHFAGKTFTDLL